MKITVNMIFDSVEDLVSFYEKVRNDDPTDYVEKTGFTKEQVDTAIAEADFASLVTPKTQGKKEPEPVTEEIPVVKSVHTREEVKAYCTKARVEKSVKIKDILLSLGVGSFKDLPDDRLDDLYDAVTAARGD